jgi:Domain of unknown function (DUF3841)
MRIWTIQPFTVWEQLQQSGQLHVDEGRLPYDGFLPEAYRWLVRQLTQMLPGYPGTLPWWGYCAKPDLRLFRHHRPAGGREVRLELEVRDGNYLTLPVWAWHTVYTGQYLSATSQEHGEWMDAMRQAVPDEDTWPLPEPWRTQLEASWQRLFDPILPPDPWDGRCIGQSGSREAVLGLLRLEDVRQVRSFVGCGRWE